MIRSNGVTRIVFEFDKFVIKIPNFKYSWMHFLKGLIANMNENSIWKWQAHPNNETARPDLLCPVLWASCGGWILIMQKAVRCEWINDESQWNYKEWIDAGFGGDDKPDNYGYLNGKMVKLDYGN